MAFNGDDWRAAHPVWSVTLDGHTYCARPVSARVVVDLVPKLLAADGTEALRWLERLFREAFPWRIEYWWWGDPVKKLFALDAAALREARDDFFGHLGASAAPSVPATNGTTSPS